MQRKSVDYSDVQTVYRDQPVAQYPKFGLNTVDRIEEKRRVIAVKRELFNKTEMPLKQPSKQEVVVYIG